MEEMSLTENKESNKVITLYSGMTQYSKYFDLYHLNMIGISKYKRCYLLMHVEITHYNKGFLACNNRSQQ